MFKESNIYSPEIAKAGSQNPQRLLNGEFALIEPVMTMEADESDEYLKTAIFSVWAPQILKFFNISNQIHSMYQLIQTHTSYLAWTYGMLHEMEGRVGTRAHFWRKKVYI